MKLIMRDYQQHLRILAIDPTSKGFGFVVLENVDRLVDWGVARVWASSDMELLARVDATIARYRPKLLVVPEIPAEPRRAKSARRVAALSTHAQHHGMQVIVVTRSNVEAAFPGKKRERAESVAARFPELRPWLPPPRRPWMTEDDRMHIFDALALAITAISVGGDAGP